MDVKRTTEKSFEAMREYGRLQPNTAYAVQERDRTTYAWTPDGDGCVWFDTLPELEAEVG